MLLTRYVTLPGGIGSQVPFSSLTLFSHVQLYPPVPSIRSHF